ncbi:formin-binding protein 1-like isoform X1 [Haliotis rubra]|uniref:formin-binding protein 1-like isoform X1 n=1 Tax=Haliotis rubra TaxID=36100 RepID=UPI001EE51106|nr:formin-binding protein 1-like isoform X1 [Haliotis rubra]
MSWGTELWDQYDNVSLHTLKGIEFCEKYTHFLKERCNVEMEYARNLKKLVKSYQPRKKEEDDYVFSWSRAFVDMVKELHDIAGQHEMVAENLQGTVFKDLQGLITELRQERKKHLHEGTRIQDALKQSYQQLDKSKRQYERAFKDSEKALDNYRKADADINLSRAEVEKHRIVMNAKASQCEDCKNEYAAQLQQTNTHQREYYSGSMPQVFQNLQDMDERRVNRLQAAIGQSAEADRNVIPIINTCIDGMQKAAAAIDAKEDSKLVIERHKSGFQVPSDIPFEDLSNMQATENSNHSTPKSAPSDMKNTYKTSTVSGKSRKRGGIFGLFQSSKVSLRCYCVDDPKEDFSDLPPNQRRKKLQQKIDAIKKEMAKEQAEREGMLKMKDVYANNPALGDPSTLDKKIEENAQKIDDLRQDLHKFENYLGEADGKHRRHSTSNESLSPSVSDGSTPASQQQVSEPGTPNLQHNVYAPIDGDEEGEDEFETFPIIGTCRALYPFDGSSEGSISMLENEEFNIIEADQGDGWTRVKRDDTSEGFVPTSYIEVHLYDQDQV